MNRRPSVVIMAGLLAGLLASSAWLGGCGQKGPLTMPSPAAAPAAPITPAALPASSPSPSK